MEHDLKKKYCNKTKNRNNCCDTDFNILIYQYLIGPRSLKIPIKITVTEEGRKTN